MNGPVTPLSPTTYTSYGRLRLALSPTSRLNPWYYWRVNPSRGGLYIRSDDRPTTALGPWTLDVAQREEVEVRGKVGGEEVRRRNGWASLSLPLCHSLSLPLSFSLGARELGKITESEHEEEMLLEFTK